MGNAKRDDNFVTTLIAVANSDGLTPAELWADPTTHRLLVHATGTITAQSDKKSTASTPGSSVIVANTSTTVIAANVDRVEVVVVNDSNETIYLKLGTGAELNKGIRLNAFGGNYICTTYTGIITAICTSGGKILTVCEV